MLYLVTLTYVRPVEEINAHLDTHKEWLVEHMRAGSILVAGPLESKTGGVVIAHCESRSELDAMIAGDSFHAHRLVDFNVLCFNPALRADAFPTRWAPDAIAIP